MKELNDNDFDRLFKQGISQEFPSFEEESWRLMEKKLDQRERKKGLVFYRNASIILLLLSFGLVLYLKDTKERIKGAVSIANKSNQKHLSKPIVQDKINQKDEWFSETKKRESTLLKPAVSVKKQIVFNVDGNNGVSKKLNPQESTEITPDLNNLPKTDSYALKSLGRTEPSELSDETNDIRDSISTKEKPIAGLKSKKKINRKIPFSLAFSVGPDFNATNKVIGGKGNIALGLSVSVGLFKKISLQTGVNYGFKKYTASNLDYAFAKPNVVNTVASINASCKVIEIPLRASFKFLDLKKSSIDLNAGLSSYLMLKEDYDFIYNGDYGGSSTWKLEKTNANQHYLSVIDLSATYNIKLSNKKFALGIEPYLKIPMSGIGEGNVPLKSSGISLKVRYDIK